MTDKPLPSFRSIAAPLDVDDAALDRLNVQLGVPTLTKPASTAKPQIKRSPITPARAENDAPRAPLEKLTIEVPSYLADAMKHKALDQRMSVRHVVMLALQASGFAIEAVDLVPDGRRKAKTQ